MCGIIGYLGIEEAGKIILEGLKRLEYRGYDSCGIAVIEKDEIKVKKDKGKIEEVENKLGLSKLKGNIGIGHTRWATHGKVCKRNAHPHLDCTKNIAIVHNGIIENYQQIKNWLAKKGHKFRSETDSEVIAHLIEEYSKQMPFLKACIQAIKSLKGSFALAILNKAEKLLVGARKESPLVVGLSDIGIFLASDVPAFLKHTKKVIYLKDYDIIFCKNGGKIKYFIYNAKEGKVVRRKIDRIDWDPEKAEKGEFEHFMLKEIYEQMQTIKLASYQPLDKLKRIANQIKKAKRIFLTGAGSSYHACLVGSYYFSKIAKKLAIPILASEFKNFAEVIGKQDVVIAVSQSGETYDVLEAVRKIKNKAKVFAIVNVKYSSLDREAKASLYLNAGPEICVLATKSYTAQLVVFYLLANALIGREEKAKQEVSAAAKYAYELMARTRREKTKEIAMFLKDKQHIFLIGRGLNYPTSLEAALKIKEVSYIHAEAFAGGELKHGTIALIEEKTPVIVFDSKETHDEIISNALELKSRGGFIIGISPKNHKVFDIWLKVPENGMLNCILQIIPMQLIAYYLAKLRGCDPDKPRNLAKSVTVK